MICRGLLKASSLSEMFEALAVIRQINNLHMLNLCDLLPGPVSN